jgi:hypothetical protein
MRGQPSDFPTLDGDDSRSRRFTEERMISPGTVFSHCDVCEQKLEHTALFCPRCGLSTCSWDCYVQHLATHTRDGKVTAEAEPSTPRNRHFDR